ncbi:hypothetical protein ACFLQT_00260 [Bacteroidota bacterium]
MHNLLLKIYLISIISTAVFAQSLHDSSPFLLDNYSSKSFIIGFDKELITYNFNTALNYNHKTGKFYLGVKENFRSAITKSSTENIKDEQFLSIIGEYEFVPSLKFGIFFNNDIYTDDRKLSINEASNLRGSLFTKYVPLNNIVIIPYVGYSNNQQIGENDKGFSYGAEVFTRNLKLHDFELNSILKFHNEDISPRKNTMRLINVNVSNVIERTLYNTATVYYNQLRKDFYFETDSLTSARFDVKNNLQSRTESNYYIQDRIFYTPGKGKINLDLQGRVSWRNINRDTRYVIPENVTASSFDSRIEEFKIDLISSAEYKTDSFAGQLRIAISERDEKHFAKQIEGANQIIYDDRVRIESRKNNSSQQAYVALSGQLQLDDKNSLLLSLLHRKLVYDTPSDENFDDRDELLTIFRVLYVRKLSPFFKVFVNLEGSLNHIVYIFAERSSNNNVRRILKLSSGGNYMGEKFQTNNSVEISANYTVYDFEELSATLRSFSFRQFSIRDSSIISLGRNTNFQFTGYLKLSEQGDFKWSDFSSRPLRFLEETYMEPLINYSIMGLTMGIGLRYFSLSTYGYNANHNKVKLSDYTSIGPLTEITLIRTTKLNLRIYGWYEFISTEDNSKRELANLSLRLNWNL